MQEPQHYAPYKVGDHDYRAWGHYVVTSVTGGEQPDEPVTETRKTIYVTPGNALSLQMHEGRSEVWMVLSGTLTVIRNGETLTLTKGESVDIPLRAIHAMANLSTEICEVHEIQSGDCNENDNIRIADFNNRANPDGAQITHDHLEDSIKAYQNVVTQLHHG